MKKSRSFIDILLITIASSASPILGNAAPTVHHTTEICVYGGTSSGLVAAIAIAKTGHKVLVIEPSRWLGGMTGGGIRVRRDCAYPHAIGGLTQQMIVEDINLGVDDPHSGQRQLRDVWLRLVKEHRIEVLYEHRLKSVYKNGTRILQIQLEKAPPQKDGCPIGQASSDEYINLSAQVFIDASYEGDLMAYSGVRYTVGRESVRQYGECLAGVRPIEKRYTLEADPFVKRGDPTSGLLPLISPEPVGNVGDASKYMLAYNFRLNGKGAPIQEPEPFEPERYELLNRMKFKKIGWPSDNFDRATLVSGGLLGPHADYPEADYATRARIWRDSIEHVKYLSKLTGKPTLLNTEDYPDTDGFPHQLYIRMGRRMISTYVMTQSDVQCLTHVDDSVGLAFYSVDIYPCRLVALADGKHIATEGEVFAHISPTPYRIPYRSIVPKREECENLIVPVCMSASHVAMASIRMEPTYMVMGESAGIAAVKAIEQHSAVQSIDAKDYRKALLAAGQILDKEPTPLRPPKVLFPDQESVSFEEWSKIASHAWEWVFDFIDQNKDGKLNKGEYETFLDFTKSNPQWHAVALPAALPNK